MSGWHKVRQRSRGAGTATATRGTTTVTAMHVDSALTLTATREGEAFAPSGRWAVRVGVEFDLAMLAQVVAMAFDTADGWPTEEEIASGLEVGRFGPIEFNAKGSCGHV